MDRQGMKVALCYYGLASTVNTLPGNTIHNLPVNYLSTYKSQIDNIIKPNNADVFIHSWSEQVKDDVVDKLKPVNYLFERQIDFHKEAEKINDNPNVTHFNQRHFILSRWYSTKKVMELKRQHEVENNFKYDCVMVTRFDAIYNTVWDLYNQDMNYFYITGGWPLSYQEGLPDLWFFSNTDTMDVYGNMYDELKEAWYYNGCDNRANEWDGHMLVRRHLGRHNIIQKFRYYKQHYKDSDIKRG